MTGSTIGQRYLIDRLLGRGGMGEVYLATDTQLQRPVAIKLLPIESAADPDPSTGSGSARARSRAERRARFEREARLAAALRHPHICTIYEIGESDGRPFIAMELVEGVTLREKCADGPLPVDDALAIAVQIADALDEAQAHQIVHRDLKSANIILTARGDVKILDFGLAKRLADADAATSDLTTAAGVSQIGQIVGTVAYMSPEQALGQPVDHRSDLFSFGVILFELLTGRLPFAGQSSVEIINAILNQAAPAIPRFNDQVPDDVVAVVNKLLEKSPDRRYQSAREVRIDLERARRNEPSVIAPVSGPRAVSVSRPRRRMRWVVGAASIAVLGAVVAWLSWDRWRPRADGEDAASVVVLPAEVFGPPELQYLADAVPATLSSHLAEIAGLETKVPPTHLEWEAVKRDPQQMVRAYAVTMYVAPHVYAQAGKLSMTFQLVRGSTRKMIWSHDYAGTPETYLAEIRSAADDLRGVLRPDARRIGSPAGQTASSQAELAFQQGTHYWHRFNNRHESADFDLSLASLSRALELDSTMADAAAEIAFLYLFKAEDKSPMQTVRPDIDRWAQRAVQIDPHCGMGWAVLSILELYNPQPDPRAMLDKALRAAKDAPRAPIVQNLLGIATQSMTLRVEAYRQALILDPLYRAAVSNLSASLFSLNRSNDALVAIDDIVSREPDLAPEFLGHRIVNLVNLGRVDEARTLLQGAPATVSPDDLRMPAIAVSLAGGDSSADAKIAAVLDYVSQPGVPGAVILTVTSRLLPFLGKYNRGNAAFRILALCADRSRLPPYEVLANDERLASLRRDPRFQRFLDRSKADLSITLQILEAARSRNELPAYLEAPLQELRVKSGK